MESLVLLLLLFRTATPTAVVCVMVTCGLIRAFTRSTNIYLDTLAQVSLGTTRDPIANARCGGVQRGSSAAYYSYHSLL
jgi:hypothetical protein